MNQLAHIFISYLVVDLIIPDAQQYLLPIILISLFMDIDHIPGYFKMFKMSKKKRKSLNMDQLNKLVRSGIQEPLGVLVMLIILGVLYLLGIRDPVVLIAAIIIPLHWLVDFLTVHTRPLLPFNNKLVVLFFDSMKQRIVSETAITTVTGILFLIAYF